MGLRKRSFGRTPDKPPNLLPPYRQDLAVVQGVMTHEGSAPLARGVWSPSQCVEKAKA